MTPYRFMWLPRPLTGLPLLFFGVKHFLDPDPFRAILIASGLPVVDVTLIAAPLAECVAAALLLSGFFARLGGVLGIVPMLPAIYATLTLKGLDPAHLPAGLTQVPFVPPLPLPIVVLVGALAVVMLGGGAWSTVGHVISLQEGICPTPEKARNFSSTSQKSWTIRFPTSSISENSGPSFIIHRCKPGLFFATTMSARCFRTQGSALIA